MKEWFSGAERKKIISTNKFYHDLSYNFYFVFIMVKQII